MSDFILNLVQRGAGLGPRVAQQPPLRPDFAPDAGAAQATKAEPETAPVNEATLEMRSATVSRSASPAATPPSTAPVRVEATPSATPPAETLHRRSQGPAPSSPRRPLTDTMSSLEEVSRPVEAVTLQPEQGVTGHTPEISLTPAEPQPPNPQDTPKPVSPTVPAPRIEPTLQVPGDTPKSSQPSHSPPLPPPAESAPRPQAPPKPFASLEIGAVAMPPAIRTRPMPEAPEATEPGAVAQVQAAAPHSTTTSSSLIRPGSPQRPMFPTLLEAAVTPSEPRPIQVRIGTIEVRASTPPPPAPPRAPTPHGFDDYVLLRNYVSWER